jgi:hypothetical protein
MSETERQKILLQQEIAKLSGGSWAVSHAAFLSIISQRDEREA